MKIAISTEGDMVSAHFGRCPSFTIVEIEDGKVITKSTIDNPGHHPGFLPKFLHERGVKVIIAGGAGQRAVGLFSEAGIEMILGINGSISDIIEKVVNGTLAGGESLCKPGDGKGYGVDKSVCDHSEEGE